MTLQITRLWIDTEDRFALDITNMGSAPVEAAGYGIGFSSIYNFSLNQSSLENMNPAPTTIGAGETITVGSRFLGDPAPGVDHDDQNFFMQFFFAENVDALFLSRWNGSFWERIDSIGEYSGGVPGWQTGMVYTASPSRLPDASVSDDFDITTDFTATAYGAPLPVSPTAGDDTLTGTDGADALDGLAGNDSLSGEGGNDTLNGGDGADTLVGGAGDDSLVGGESADDLRDVIYGGDGNDLIEGGYGNDELRGDAGDDTIEGGFGADTVIGAGGADILTGSAWSDLIFGGNGDDFVNGGWGHDRVNGGAGADRFFHIGIRDHGSDWIQDY
ncbi:calcium-binding protein, partial [Shimia sp. SDUM112013]|uniref:calcium-binding protein n=1 Tax=Shimia sp. SDUM112013 TaxID=3136160 RepID=UPI0032EC80A5